MGRVLRSDSNISIEAGSQGAIRVLVVDGSTDARRLIRTGLEKASDIHVVAEAETVVQARDAIKNYRPDVMTLDIEFPGGDGIELLYWVMRARPMPVVMLSSSAMSGSAAAVRAMAGGAVDWVEKPGAGATGRDFTRLANILRQTSLARVRAPMRRLSEGSGPVEPWRWNGKWVLIGASTGGVEALDFLLHGFPPNCPPILITQHMPAPFLESFAARLNEVAPPMVRVARHGDRPTQGLVLLAPGTGTHMVLDASGNRIRLSEGPKHSGHRPSIDAMMISAVPTADRTIAAILTGMGRDGARGMLALRGAGAECLGQNKVSSVIYGMPRVARELGGVEQELSLHEMAAEILKRASA